MSAENETEPVLPPKKKKNSRGHSLYLEDSLWDALLEIAHESGEYSRNEVIVHFLWNRVEAWRKQRTKQKAKG